MTDLLKTAPVSESEVARMANHDLMEYERRQEQLQTQIVQQIADRLKPILLGQGFELGKIRLGERFTGGSTALVFPVEITDVQGESRHLVLKVLPAEVRDGEETTLHLTSVVQVIVMGEMSRHQLDMPELVMADVCDPALIEILKDFPQIQQISDAKHQITVSELIEGRSLNEILIDPTVDVDKRLELFNLAFLQLEKIYQLTGWLITDANLGNYICSPDLDKVVWVDVGGAAPVLGKYNQFEKLPERLRKPPVISALDKLVCPTELNEFKAALFARRLYLLSLFKLLTNLDLGRNLPEVAAIIATDIDKGQSLTIENNQLANSIIALLEAKIGDKSSETSRFISEFASALEQALLDSGNDMPSKWMDSLKNAINPLKDRFLTYFNSQFLYV